MLLTDYAAVPNVHILSSSNTKLNYRVFFNDTVNENVHR